MQKLITYLQQLDIACTHLDALPKDASTRQYYRIKGHAQPLLLVETPIKDIAQNINFCRIAGHLHQANISAPTILHSNHEAGLLVVEDFGQTSFRDFLTQETYTKIDLYKAATRMLITMNRTPRLAVLNLAEYSVDIMLNEAMLLADYYLPAQGKKLSDTQKQQYRALWQHVITTLKPYQPALILRDFHIDNIFYLQNRPPIAHIGVIDFQDALMGPPAFDFMSLLEDARYDVPQDIQQTCLNMAIEHLPYHVEEADFIHWYHVSAAIRHAKVLGLFTRLGVHEGKTQYLQYIPHIERLFERKLQYPLLQEMQAFINAL